MSQGTQIPLNEEETHILRHMEEHKFLPLNWQTKQGFKRLSARGAFFGLKEGNKIVIVLSAEGYKLLGRLPRGEEIPS